MRMLISTRARLKLGFFDEYYILSFNVTISKWCLCIPVKTERIILHLNGIYLFSICRQKHKVISSNTS